MRFVKGHNRRLAGVDYIVDEESGCWVWQLHRLEKGYGVATNPSGQPPQVLAHRLFYKQQRGPIPEGYELHHRCENPPCVNPEHLEPLTPEEHTARHAGRSPDVQ